VSLFHEIRETCRCPSCGGLYYMGECRHSSSGLFGTLYGVCKKCAGNHAKFSQEMKALDDPGAPEKDRS
jgi:hypothetical protein